MCSMHKQYRPSALQGDQTTKDEFWWDCFPCDPLGTPCLSAVRKDKCEGRMMHHDALQSNWHEKNEVLMLRMSSQVLRCHSRQDGWCSVDFANLPWQLSISRRLVQGKLGASWQSCAGQPDHSWCRGVIGKCRFEETGANFSCSALA